MTTATRILVSLSLATSLLACDDENDPIDPIEDVTIVDVAADNGIIHVIDSVLLPPQ